MQFFISLTRVLYIIRARNIDQYYGNNDDDDGGGGDMNGEAVCEGKDFSQRQCLDVGCCYWEEGECWSAVGRDSCDGNQFDDDDDDDDDNNGDDDDDDDNGDDDDGGGGDMNGEAACEGRDFNKLQCRNVGCCYWEEGECWSGVGRDSCDSNQFSDDDDDDDDDDNGDDDDDDDDDDNDDDDSDDDNGGGNMNGEAVCEGKNFNRGQCRRVGCCYWEEGECWSAVGRNKCDRFNRKRDLGATALRGTLRL